MLDRLLLTPEELLVEPTTSAPHWATAWYARVRAADATWDADPLPRDAALATRIADAHVPPGHPPFHPDLGFGCRVPDLVILGDRKPASAPLPWFARSLSMLARALRLVGYDELVLWLGNAHTDDGKRRTKLLRAMLGQATEDGAVILVLGRKAQMAVNAAGLTTGVYADHPQYWGRFKKRRGYKGYAAHLMAQGLLPGPYHGREVPSVRVPDARAALADRFDLPQGVAYVPDPAPPSASGGIGVPHVRDPRYEKLRTAYVLGEYETISQGARALKLRPSDAQKVARAENWYEERTAHEESVRQKVYDDAAEAEAEAKVAARRLAWGGATTALRSVLERMQLPQGDPRKLIPSPMEAARLVTAAMALAEVGDASADPDLARLQKLGLPGLLGELQDMAAGMAYGERKTQPNAPSNGKEN